ncbi:hypothetical protein B0J18DRAFT_262722 [Chaetomium sp. MPI-SDFR-AT-0129]|nr:hypothetical protein B0J18DRAFT_262722 [Chaetomium sp. MPI-SDFR-AT-0129]
MPGCSGERWSEKRDQLAVDSLRVLLSTLWAPCVLLGIFSSVFPQPGLIYWATAHLLVCSSNLPHPLFRLSAPFLCPPTPSSSWAASPNTHENSKLYAVHNPHGALGISNSGSTVSGPRSSPQDPLYFHDSHFSVCWLGSFCLCTMPGHLVLPLPWTLPVSLNISILDFSVRQIFQVSSFILLFFSRLRPILDKAMPHG